MITLQKELEPLPIPYFEHCSHIKAGILVSSKEV